MSAGEGALSFLMALGTLLALVVLVPVALVIGGGAGLLVASGLWH